MIKKKKEVQWKSDNIKALRTHLGLTQQQMADQLGTRQQTVSEWEVGIYQPRGISCTLLNMIAEHSGFQYKTKKK